MMTRSRCKQTQILLHKFWANMLITSKLLATSWIIVDARGLFTIVAVCAFCLLILLLTLRQKRLLISSSAIFPTRTNKMRKLGLGSKTSLHCDPMIHIIVEDSNYPEWSTFACFHRIITQRLPLPCSWWLDRSALGPCEGQQERSQGSRETWQK